MTKIFSESENQAWSKTLSGKMCSACLLICSSDRVLMVKASYKDHWTFPSGIVDDKESPSHAAIRETSEEVGLQINEDKCDSFTIIYTSSKGGDRDRFNFAFITDLGNELPQLSVPNDEIAEAKWVTFDKIAELSNQKGSYIKFQQFLLQTEARVPYVEI